MPDINENRNAQEKEFQEAFDKISKNQPVDPNEGNTALYQDHLSALGNHLHQLFELAERDRRNKEMVWIQDLRQYRGEYEPEVLKRLHPMRSKANLPITRTKVKTISARMTDLLFPANGEQNWAISKTPIPEMDPSVIQNIMLQYQQATGQQPTEELVLKFIHEEATKRCIAMEKEMADQLTELKYRETIRQCILSGNLYGTGVLKGPLVKTIKSNRWLPNRSGQGNPWVSVKLEKKLPYCEHVPIWDIYPDMAATRPDDLRYIFQRYVMPRNKVYALAQRPDFNGKAISDYLKAHPGGDADYRAHENDLRTVNVDGQAPGGSNIPLRRERYEVKEFWGYVNTNQLVELGVEVDPEKMGIEVAANIWTLGPLVIKAIISPIEGVVFPYHFYFYEKDDTCFFGEGIPSIMRDPQKLFNASVRAMLDNAAIAAGPLVEVNMDLLEPDSGPSDIHPFKVYHRNGEGSEASAPAVRVYTMPSYTNEYMQLANYFMTAADEITAIPRYMYGDSNQVSGAGKTATGLSMLMGAANVTLKDQVKNFDDGITVPFIKALYFWNMQFNPKEHIKGDFGVKAKGSTSLIAREVKAESLNQFMAVTNNPTDLMFTKRDAVLREYVKVLDLDDLDLIKDPQTVKMEMDANNKAMEDEKAFQREIALLKAKSGGHMNSAAGMTPGINPQMQRLDKGSLEGGAIPEVTDGSGEVVTAGVGV